jgi:ABC-type bacteriocin/lantibiotic exporter with double-glycine peptidase domain
MSEIEQPLHINVRDLTFAYPNQAPVLRNLNMQLTNGARCLLIGANGAGLNDDYYRVFDNHFVS